jgi:hypothetical protein
MNNKIYASAHDVKHRWAITPKKADLDSLLHEEHRDEEPEQLTRDTGEPVYDRACA